MTDRRVIPLVATCLVTVVGFGGYGSDQPQPNPVARQPSSLPVPLEDYRILVRAVGTENPSDHTSSRNTATEIFKTRNLVVWLPDVLRASTVAEQKAILSAVGYTRDGRLAPILIDLLNIEELAYRAIEALAEIGLEALPQLLAAVQDPGPHPVWPPPSPVGKRTFQGGVRNAINRIGARALPFLLAQLTNRENAGRRKTLDVLSQMHRSVLQHADWRPYMDLLWAAIAGQDASSRYAALRILTQIETLERLNALTLAIRGDADPAIASWANDLAQVIDQRRRCRTEVEMVRAALADRGPAAARSLINEVRSVIRDDCDPEYAEYLTTLLRDARMPVRHLAAATLGEMGIFASREALRAHFTTERAPTVRASIIGSGPFETTEEWRAVLRSSNLKERALALEAIGRSRNAGLIPELRPFLSDRDLSRAAAQALSEIKHVDAIPLLIEASRNASRTDTESADPFLGTIAYIGGLQGVSFVAEALVSAPRLDTRFFAARYSRDVVGQLGRVEEFRNVVKPSILKALSDPSPEVRGEVVPLLNGLGGVDVVVALINSDPDESVRIVAFESLGDNCSVDAAPALTNLFASIDAGRRARAASVMARLKFCRNTEIVRVLRDANGAQLISMVIEGSAEAASRAAFTLASLKHPQGVDPVIRRFEQSPDERMSLAFALGEYGSMAKAARSVLERARIGASPDLIRILEQTLNQIR